MHQKHKTNNDIWKCCIVCCIFYL